MTTATAQLEEVHTAWVRDLQDARTKRQALVDQYRDLQEQLDRITAAGQDGACPTCSRPLGPDYTSVLGVLGRQVEEVKFNGQFYRQRIDQLQEEPAPLRDLRRQLEAAERAATEAAGVVAKLEAQHKEASGLAARRVELERSLAALQGEMVTRRGRTTRNGMPRCCAGWPSWSPGRSRRSGTAREAARPGSRRSSSRRSRGVAEGGGAGSAPEAAGGTRLFRAGVRGGAGAARGGGGRQAPRGARDGGGGWAAGDRRGGCPRGGAPPRRARGTRGRGAAGGSRAGARAGTRPRLHRPPHRPQQRAPARPLRAGLRPPARSDQRPLRRPRAGRELPAHHRRGGGGQAGHQRRRGGRGQPRLRLATSAR